MQNLIKPFLFLCLVLPAVCGTPACGAGQPLKKVLFTFQGPARSVCVSGDFNQWATDRDCLRAGDNGWTLALDLAPGTYRYLFLVDGHRWVGDPHALWQEDDGFGRRNAVRVVE